MWNLIWVVVFALVHMSCSFMYSLLYANRIHVQMYFQREYDQISLLSKIWGSNSLAQSLPSLVLQGKAVSTVKQYSGAYVQSMEEMG